MVDWSESPDDHKKGKFHTVQGDIEVQLNLALTDFRGPSYFICYRQNSVTANIGNKIKQVEGPKNQYLF